MAETNVLLINTASLLYYSLIRWLVFLASAPARLARHADKVTVKYVEVKIIKNDGWDHEKNDSDRLIKGDRLTQVSFTVIN